MMHKSLLGEESPFLAFWARNEEASGFLVRVNQYFVAVLRFSANNVPDDTLNRPHWLCVFTQPADVRRYVLEVFLFVGRYQLVVASVENDAYVSPRVVVRCPVYIRSIDLVDPCCWFVVALGNQPVAFHVQPVFLRPQIIVGVCSKISDPVS